MVLFIHLKIILLQCFSVFSCIQTNPKSTFFFSYKRQVMICLIPVLHVLVTFTTFVHKSQYIILAVGQVHGGWEIETNAWWVWAVVLDFSSQSVDILELKTCLVVCFNIMFSVFKQYYIYFYIFFTYMYFKKIQITLLKQHYQMAPKGVAMDNLFFLGKSTLISMAWLDEYLHALWRTMAVMAIKIGILCKIGENV